MEWAVTDETSCDGATKDQVFNFDPIFFRRCIPPDCHVTNTPKTNKLLPNSLASISIYAGAFGSLPNPKSPSTQKGGDDGVEEEIEERLSSEDAWLFPVIGSVVLCGLYYVIKYFGKEWINWLLGWYFALAGVGSLWKSLISLTKFIVGEATWNRFDKLSVSVKKGSTSLLSLSGRTPSLILFPLAIIPSAFFALGRKSVLITDILSLSFSHNALAMLKIDSFKTGTILLSGLFFYDIWWVFGTEVMVKVATTLDVPIKLLWPKSLIFSDARGYTMLGLGDVVVPGTFIALALRYDHHQFLRSSQKTFGPKPYFYASLSAYILGLIATMTVMHVFGKAQPALLYLSPACIVSFVLTAIVRGELGEAWAWSDTPKNGEDSEKKDDDGKVSEESRSNKTSSVN